MSSPPLNQPGRRAGLFKRPVHAQVSPRWPQVLVQVREQPRVRGFVSATWPSCRGPQQPTGTDLAVVPSATPGSPNSNAWPPRPRHLSSRHILCPTDLRAFQSVPSNADPCAYLLEPRSI
ncbi:MAG TPA: hypothetical protein VEL76_09870, partial [Gemmataceae bacterium]|nr:hypothetical protein [Gemmataceae bacterium]